MKRLSIILLFILGISLVSCTHNVANNSADAIQQRQTAQQLAEANKQLGMPAIKNYWEREQVKLIIEMRDNPHLICYAYLYNRDNGTIGQFLGKCIGFGIPYSVQYTNPKKLVDMRTYFNVSHNMWDPADITKMPQADPNGLFMPQGLSATWLMLLDAKGIPHPVYIEPEIIVSPFPLKNK